MKSEDKNEIIFQKLTPNDDIELGIYEKALDYALNDDKVRNIAVSGAYGAGKSSIIETYKKTHGDKKYLHIALAHFSEENNKKKDGEMNIDKKQDEKKDKLNNDTARITNDLEIKIINQLLYQISPEKIPETRFRIKDDSDDIRTKKIMGIITIFPILVLYISFFEQLYKIIHGMQCKYFIILFSFIATNEFRMIAIILLCILIGYSSYHIINLQMTKRFIRKINIKNNSLVIELADNSDESCFDRYLGEVLYLFEHAGADVIVFEDMDRYGDNFVFEKLREINTLLNVRKKELKTKKDIRFVYLVKDDVFESKDRVKFFDFIIPVVSVVDRSNSYDQIFKLFKDNGISGLIQADFLNELSYYIDDMRILKNIFNEFLVYYSKFQENATAHNWNKLLAMIAYKNLFPQDFIGLQMGEGYVSGLFDRKELIVKKEIQKLNEKINGKKEELSQINGDLSSNNKFNNAEDTIEKKMKSIQCSIDKLERQIEYLRDADLKDVITKENEKNIFSFKYKNEFGVEMNYDKIKESLYYPLIKNFVRLGYIDETYPDYMTYFYGEKISRRDKIFLRHIREGSGSKYNYKLDSPEIVIKNISCKYFECVECHNYMLLDEMLSNPHEYSEKKNILIDNLINNERFNFIAAYLKNGKMHKEFVYILNDRHSNVNGLILQSKIIDEIKRIYVIDILCIYSAEEILIIDENGYIVDYLNYNAEILKMDIFDEFDIDGIADKISELGVKFKNFKFIYENIDLLRKLYERNAYELNLDNIYEILNYYYDMPMFVNYKSMTFKLILSEQQPLREYVLEEIQEFTKNYVRSTSVIEDGEEEILIILNSDNVEYETKLEYISLCKTKIKHLSSIKNVKLWPKLLVNYVNDSHENIFDYFYESGNGMDEVLVSYINNYAESLDLDTSKLDEVYGENAQTDLSMAILSSNSIENEKYKILMNSFNWYYPSFDIKDISDEKMQILIEERIIRISSDNLDQLHFIRNNYKNVLNEYIVTNIDKYNENMTEKDFAYDELIYILDLPIDDEIKLNLLSFTDKSISIIDKGYSEKVNAEILTNNFDKSEMDEIYQWYPEDMPIVVVTIEDMIINKLEYVIDNEKMLHPKLLYRLMYNKRVTQEEGLELLAYHIPKLNKRDIVRCFEGMNMENYVNLLDGNSNPAVEKNKFNEAVLKALVERDWISKYEIDKKHGNKYRAFSHRKKR